MMAGSGKRRFVKSEIASMPGPLVVASLALARCRFLPLRNGMETAHAIESRLRFPGPHSATPNCKQMFHWPALLPYRRGLGVEWK
jgi:hypothetical protein